MKLKMGPGQHDITLYDRDNELLVGRREDGTFVNKLHLMEAEFRMGATSFPILRLEIELIGYEVELEAMEDDVVASLNRKGITRIEGRKAENNADLHPDA